MKLSEELQARGFIYQSSADDVGEILDGKPRTVYLGIDPTARSIHVGNLVPYMLLNRLMQAGHKVILLMGGGTALIGDPGGKSEERPFVAPEVIAQQAKVQIPYSCERGDCGTCSVKFNGKIVKACQVSLPAASKEKKFTIEVNTSISFPTYPLLIVNSRNAFLYVAGVEERFLFYKTNEGLNLLVVHCTHDSLLFSMS